MIKCRCGSGQYAHPLYDARHIFCAYVCEICEKVVRGRYRPEIFTDPDYWTLEEIDA